MSWRFNLEKLRAARLGYRMHGYSSLMIHWVHCSTCFAQLAPIVAIVGCLVPTFAEKPHFYLHRGLKRSASGRQVAFPYNFDAPTQTPQRGYYPSITLNVPTKFLFPECRIALRGSRYLATGVSMPEATMNEDNRTMSREHQVRTPGKTCSA